jgi:hypothetical protein
MKKLKITESQYNRLLSEIEGIKGGINRVDTNFKKEFRNADVVKLKPNSSMMEDESGTPFNIKDRVPNLPNSKMKKKPEPQAPIKEDIFSPDFHQAIYNVIENIWMNPSQRGLDKAFTQQGITWGDIITYLTGVGIVGATGAGIYKIKNFFKTKFSPDQKEAMQQKMQDIEKITKMVEKDPEAPWNQETTYEKKQRMQARPETDYKAEPKPFNPNRFKPGLEETEEDEYAYDKDYYNDTEKEYTSKSPKVFKGIGMGKELVVLNGPNGNYVFDYSNNGREDFPNSNYELALEDIVDFVNDNYKDNSQITMGSGLQSFETGDDLVKLDDELKAELSTLYSKDVKFVELLNKLEETTTTASSGAFTGPLGAGKPQISPGYSPADIINDEDSIYGKKIEETTTAAGGTPQSSSTGQYTQPKIWAKNKANWAASKRTQYPHGEMVEFDPCTKFNNNKSAQNGKCSQGAVDKVVKTYTTPQSVISKTVYEEVAKRTGRTLEEVETIIQTKKNKG